MSHSSRSALAVVAAAAAGLLGTSAFAATPWQKSHPWRAHDNQRIANQERRIAAEVKEGEMTHRQAKALRANDRKVGQEERAMASMDHGHLTAADQRALTQQLNQNSRAIGK
ncbi:MAG: hypothetical protein U1F07_05875 [Rubrivivax sp.]